MTNYSNLNESELIETLANFTDKYTESFKSESDAPNQWQYKEVIDELVNEFSRRRTESPWNYQQH